MSLVYIIIFYREREKYLFYDLIQKAAFSIGASKADILTGFVNNLGETKWKSDIQGSNNLYVDGSP